MLYYQNGVQMEVQDCVHFEDEPGNGVIIEVIDTIEKQQKWGIKTFGIMVESKHYGRAFYSTEVMLNDPPILICKASPGSV